MHLHLDLIGGLSGDMFIGAMLDAFPQLGNELEDVIASAGFPQLVRLSRQPYHDGTLGGLRFGIEAGADAEGHDHRHHGEIRRILQGSRLDDRTRHHALEMFRLLAEAEAEVHGSTVDDVAFHELGAWDSIADIVCAAWLIARFPAAGWSLSSVPIGRGRITGAHGLLPVPAPATALLLKGFACHDDGREGERVTPTGAAILRHLAPGQSAAGALGTLRRTGNGFGRRRFEGLSNVARLLVFEAAETHPWLDQQVVQLNFEIDDQTPEELAQGLARIAALPGVLDIQQSASFGKKNRLFSAIQLLVEPARETAVINECFVQTTTLGIRRLQLARAVLEREALQVHSDGATYRAKRALRPGGASVKAEIDDLAPDAASFGALRVLRSRVESLAAEAATEPKANPSEKAP